MDNHTLLSSFGKWVAPINIEKLTEQIMQTGQDRYTKKFTTYSYIKLLLLSHLEEVESLHAMSDTLFDDDVQQELGLGSISVSQLSRKHRTVDPNLLAAIFYQLVDQIRHSQPGRTVMPVKIIDSSTIPLNLTNHPWATFRKTKGGVKLHLRLVFMENGSSYPEYANITTANEHDRNQLEVLVDDKEATYVFDRGYIDYERFDRMTDDGYFFVSRLKKNSITRTIKAFEVEQDSTIVTDQMVAV
ncbi:IS4 family transposase, partial [Lentibacillus jeotgali]|uniref:IS4 family transposase n=1 Tax=Lentibacillus jeotgali TaxID=558169 RepID=UPI0002628F97